MAYTAGLILRQEEIEHCVDMYRALSDETFMPSSRQAAITSLWKAVRQKRFVRCLRRGDTIVAWIYSDKVQLLHMDFPVFQQIYYASDQKDTAAARCVTLLHECMVDYAKSEGFRMATSAGSHLDETYTFARILERHGWLRRGYGAALHLTANPVKRQDAPPTH